MPSPYAHFATHYRSRRLAGYDYRRTGSYFITICTQDRLPHFGEIRRGIVGLSPLGCRAHGAWHSVVEASTYTRSEAFIVMPNHIHALVTSGNHEPVRPPTLSADLRGPASGSLGTLVGSFKAIVTRRARREGIPFAWQSRFYDHVVRTDVSFQRIKTYILDNPTRWEDDCYRRP